MATSNFIFREEWLTFTEDLEIQEQNNVIRAIIAYAFDRELPEMSKAESVAFKCIKTSVDRDREKYTKRCERNRRNGNKGGRPSANDEKPTGLFGFLDETQEKPSENQEQQWVSDGVQSQSQSQSQSYSYYSFSILCPVAMQHCDETDWDNKEQQEQECILSYFFFKNWAAPSEEYKKFVAYNNQGDRPYASLTSEQKESIAVLWQQKPQKPPRFKPSVLEFFMLMYTAACSSHQEFTSRMMFLADNLSISIKDDALYIVCSKPLYMHIENQLEVYKPIIREFGKTMKVKDFRYTLV